MSAAAESASAPAPLTADQLQQLGRTYLETRRQVQYALETLHECQRLWYEAEQTLLDAINNAAGEDDGTSLVVDGVCLVIEPEYWEVRQGDRFQIHRLLQVQS